MKNNTTDITLVLDRSGSMGAIRNDTIHGVNTFIDGQKKVPGEARITLVQFDDQYEPILNAVPIKDANPLTEETYVPRGWTALHGAIGRTIEDAGRRFKAMADSERPEKVVFVIITDGEENSSGKYEWSKAWNADKVKQMIEHQSGTYKWEFVFIGANQDAVTVSRDLGIAGANALNYAANQLGTSALYASLGDNVRSFRVGQKVNMSWESKQRKDQEDAKS